MLPRQPDFQLLALCSQPEPERCTIQHTEISEPIRPQRVITINLMTWRCDMLRGGLLWLIGIPLPIILILFLMGYL